MNILGIDPGTAQMGWGIIENKKVRGRRKKPLIKHVDHGSIKTPSSEALSKRLLTIKNRVEEIVTDHDIGEIVIERVVFNINKRSAISVAQSYGVVMLLAGEYDIPVFEYNALEAKLQIAGHGRADKKLVQKKLQQFFKMKKHPTPVHAADALAIALCHIQKSA